MSSPTPKTIIEVRLKTGLTQTKAAGLVHVKLRSWQHWEAGDRAMHPGFWELFRIKSAVITK